MAKQMKSDTLKTVVIKGVINKPKSVLKGGAQIPTKKVDSIRNANPTLGKSIGKPYKGSGGMDTYGDVASDKIKMGLKPRK